MRAMVTAIWLVVCIVLGGSCTNHSSADQEDGTIDAEPRAMRVLVFTKTAGFRHGSIPAGIRCVRELGAEHGFEVDATEDSARFTDASLEPFDVVMFLNTTGDVLDESQQESLQRFVRSGGGWMGVHSASDTEYDWPWYGKLVGAYFKSHPKIQEARLEVVDGAHPSTAHLAEEWIRRDEWYDFRAPPVGVRLLVTLDEESYQGGRMGVVHPMAWCHEYDGGRAFYTAPGHTDESYEEPAFRTHLLGGLKWAAGRAD